MPRVARDWGVAEHLRILPFKGLYLAGDARVGPLSVHIYPVPNLDMPFLGVHFTTTVSGAVKIGPTAQPAAWRENYGGMQRFSARELGSVVARQARLAFGDPTFRRLAAREGTNTLRRVLARRASSLVRDMDMGGFTRWGRAGIRAQLLDTRTDTLIMDFLVEEGDHSLHVLNAVSPAFTCSLPFAEWLVDRIEGRA